MINQHTIDRERTAIRNGAAIQERPDAGVLSLRGEDRVDFLQRMTTNDIAALQTYRSTVTVLPSPTARILFVFTVLALEDELLCLPAVGQTEVLEKHLRGQIFFMDKVTVVDRSRELTRLRLMGAYSHRLLEATGIIGASSEFDDEPDGHAVFKDGMFAIKQTQYDVPGVELLIPSVDVLAIKEALLASGAQMLTNDEVYTDRRIELGRPKVNYELTDDYNPLEAGLAWTCSDDKGCYTGQEIIARQITYDKITRSLVGLISAEQIPGDQDITVDGRKVGTITSVGHSPSASGHMALAIVRRPHNEPETLVEIGQQVATVKSLPFN